MKIKHPFHLLCISTLVFLGLSLLWYADQVKNFGFALDQVDLMGSYFIAAIIAVTMALMSNGNLLNKSQFIFIIGAISIMTSTLFLGQFLATFDGSVYAKNEPISFDILRAIMLASAITATFTLKPYRHLAVPKYLLIITALAATYWVFVYACPSIVREWHGTRSGPNGILLLRMRNPERDVQRDALIFFTITWLATIIIGHIRYKKNKKQASTSTITNEKT